MADFIDQLLVSLSLDSSDFVSKSQAARDDLAKTSQASGKTAVAVQEQGKKTEKSWLSSSKAIAAGTDKVSASFEALARTALDVFAVFTSIKGAEEAVADITALNNSLRLTAQSTGVAADVIYGWRESVRSIGGDANSATAAITALATAGANWDVYRQTSAGKELSFMGVTAAMLKNPTDALMQLARARVQRHMSNADFEVIAAKVGVSGDMAHLLELPMAQIQAKLGKFTALGPSQSDINDASALTDQWVTLEDTVGKALQELYQDAAPFLKGCVAFLQKIADLAVKHPEIGGAAAAAGSVIAGAAGLAFTKRAISWLLGGGGAASKAARAAAVDELEAGGATIGGGGAVVLSTLAAGALVGFEAGNIIQTAPGHNPNLAAKGLPPDVEAEVRKDALKNHIDPDAAVDQFRIEGGGYNNVSPSGAFGPSQLMPGTAGDLGVAQSVDDPTYSWQANVDAGTRYMKQMQAMFPGDPDRALVAYNWGPGNGLVSRVGQAEPRRPNVSVGDRWEMAPARCEHPVCAQRPSRSAEIERHKQRKHALEQHA
jgi:hypothetical protein